MRYWAAGRNWAFSKGEQGRHNSRNHRGDTTYLKYYGAIAQTNWHKDLSWGNFYNKKTAHCSNLWAFPLTNFITYVVVVCLWNFLLCQRF